MSGSVYLVWAEGTTMVKVGYSDKPARRLAGLQTGCPHRLCILAAVYGVQSDERYAHQCLAHIRVDGEWFDLSLLSPRDVLDVSASSQDNPVASVFGHLLAGVVRSNAARALKQVICSLKDPSLMGPLLDIFAMCVAADTGRMVAHSDSSVTKRIIDSAPPIAFGARGISHQELLSIRA